MKKNGSQYTMPISDIYGLRAAIDNIAADPDILVRHEKIATASRKAITGAGLNLYLKSGFSSTVTVIRSTGRNHRSRHS